MKCSFSWSAGSCFDSCTQDSFPIITKPFCLQWRSGGSTFSRKKFDLFKFHMNSFKFDFKVCFWCLENWLKPSWVTSSSSNHSKGKIFLWFFETKASKTKGFILEPNFDWLKGFKRPQKRLRLCSDVRPQRSILKTDSESTWNSVQNKFQRALEDVF